MTAKPILFSAPMVAALLDGRKTQTRRLFVPPLRDFKLRYAPGDRFWVKETTAIHPGIGWFGYIHGPNPVSIEELKDAGAKIIPSIFMKREDSRLTLEITGVKVEKLGDISEIDAVAEGVGSVTEFIDLWTSIHKSWEPERWIYALQFRVELKAGTEGI